METGRAKVAARLIELGHADVDQDTVRFAICIVNCVLTVGMEFGAGVDKRFRTSSAPPSSPCTCYTWNASAIYSTVIQNRLYNRFATVANFLLVALGNLVVIE